ncbi:anhydro-N-acetylmuramic acid kinase [Candidatus Avelusimicrobium faecicola]|uniref:anhydro-N-acetylmuramic acid kinase n=1 Tax=Candidatus Avelusimicrobium faecicola TaxID=3416205 RepID=UPI003D12CA09
MKTKLALGLMSGTSADGLTVCAVRVRPFEVVAFQNYAYPPALQQQLLNAYQLPAAPLSQLHFALGKLYAQKVKLFLKKYRLSAGQISVIGSHGQTVYHGPKDKTPNTLQIGEPSFLACETGIPVVSDFRPKDMALGGEGAPLIPFFDTFLWGKKAPRTLVNVGGISNVTAVGRGIFPTGFDSGPGNTLMDITCQQVLHRPFDKNGALARKGRADKALVRQLLNLPYFAQKPPKSLDKNTFGYAFLQKYFTLSAAITRALDFLPPACRTQIWVSGGGAFNQTLLDNLQTLNPHAQIHTTQEMGLHPLAKESAAFAVMAHYALHGKINHCARATGARKNAVLGKITLCK